MSTERGVLPHETAGHRARPEAAAAPTGRLRRFLSVLARTLLPIAVLIGGGAVFAYLQATKPTLDKKPAAERAWPVTATTVEKATIAPTLVLYGTIVAGRTVDMRPLVSGRISRVGPEFAIGGLVRKDDLLVAVDAFDYEAALSERKAQLAEARARLSELIAELGAEREIIKYDGEQVAIRRREVERRSRLQKRGSGTEKSLDDAQSALIDAQRRDFERKKRIGSLEARIQQQRAAIDRSRVALRRAEKNLSDTVLHAPFDGILSEVSVEIGKRVSTGDKVARLTDAASLEVEFQVTDDQYGRLVADGSLIGETAAVIWKTARRSFEYSATIMRVSGQATSEAGGINLFARLSDTGLDTALRPGIFVEVHVKDQFYRDVFRLPEESVHDGRTVFVIADGWRLEQREISIVRRLANTVLVRGALEDGERVVTRLFPEIGPGVKVRVP